jgi:hypothetical protein
MEQIKIYDSENYNSERFDLLREAIRGNKPDLCPDEDEDWLKEQCEIYAFLASHHRKELAEQDMNNVLTFLQDIEQGCDYDDLLLQLEQYDMLNRNIKFVVIPNPQTFTGRHIGAPYLVDTLKECFTKIRCVQWSHEVHVTEDTGAFIVSLIHHDGVNTYKIMRLDNPKVIIDTNDFGNFDIGDEIEVDDNYLFVARHPKSEVDFDKFLKTHCSELEFCRCVWGTKEQTVA